MKSPTELKIDYEKDYVFDVSVDINNKSLSAFLLPVAGEIKNYGTDVYEDGRIVSAFTLNRISLFPEFSEDVLWVLMHGLWNDGISPDLYVVNKSIDDSYDAISRDYTRADVTIEVKERFCSYEEEEEFFDTFEGDEDDAETEFEKKYPLKTSSVWKYSFDGENNLWVLINKNGEVIKTGKCEAACVRARKSFKNSVTLVSAGCSAELPCKTKDGKLYFDSENSRAIEDYTCLKKIGDNRYEIIFPESREVPVDYNGLSFKVVSDCSADSSSKHMAYEFECLDYCKYVNTFVMPYFKQLYFGKYNNYCADPVHEIKQERSIKYAVNSILGYLERAEALLHLENIAETTVADAHKKKNGTLHRNRIMFITCLNPVIGYKARLHARNISDDTVSVSFY